MRGVCSPVKTRPFQGFSLWRSILSHIADALDKVPDFIGPLIACEQFSPSGCSGARVRKGYAINGIWPGGEALRFRQCRRNSFRGQNYGCAFRPAAIQLRCMAGPVRPAALELFQIPQEFLGIICNAQNHWASSFLLDNAVATPAFAVLHLFVGQDRMAGRAPVCGAFYGKSGPFRACAEKRLLPAIVFRPAGGDFAGPVMGKTHAFELGAHFRRYCRMSIWRGAGYA